MGNSIFADTLSLIPFLHQLALAQEKPSSPPAQLWPAPAPVAFAVVGSWLTATFLALPIRKAEQKKISGRRGKLDVNIDT